jgi:uncharacterized protein (DUF488 family)
VSGFRGYADYMASPDFDTGLQELAVAASRRTTAMMCAEALWWRCHRRLVSDALVVRGWEVVHVASKGSTATHELTPFAVIEAGIPTYPPRASEAAGERRT